LNNLSFNKKGIKFEPLNSWILSDGNIIAIYQGNRGENPELDFIIKYKTPTTRLRAPSHTHWIVDLIIKSSYSTDDIKDFVEEWIELYEKIEPFRTKEERNDYTLIYNQYFSEKYYNLDNLGFFNIEIISSLLELFIKCEKQTSGAFMFKNLLNLVKDFCQDKKDFYQVISYSKRV